MADAPEPPKVVALRAPAEPDAAVIRDIEHLLEQARRGDVVMVAIAAARRDHVRLTYLSHEEGDGLHDLVAALRVVTLRLDKALFEAPRVEPLT